MKMNGKRIDIEQLDQELRAAEVPFTALGFTGVDPENPGVYEDLWDIVDGWQVELPPEAEPVVDAHVPRPQAIEYAATAPVDAVIATTDDQPHVVFQFSTLPKHVYTAIFYMTAVDRANGTTKRTSAEMVFKRPGATLAQVGSTYVPATFQDTGASTWGILPTVVGTDLVISVRGAAGRTIDWLLTGTIGSYAPGGVEG